MTLSVGELSEALDNLLYSNSTDAPAATVLNKIQQQLNEAGWLLDEGRLLLERSSGSRTVDDGCNSTVVRYMDTSIRLTNDTALNIELKSLYDTIRVDLELGARLLATGRAQQVFGFRLGRCQELATDNFDFAIGGNLQLAATLAINLNPTLFDDGTLLLQPDFNVDATVLEWSPKTDVDDSLARAIIEKLLLADLKNAFSGERLKAELNAINAAQLSDGGSTTATGFTDDIAGDISDLTNVSNSAIAVRLPDPNDEQIQALYDIVSPDARFPLTLDYVRSRRLPLMSALLIGDTDRLEALLNDALTCEVSQVLETSLSPNPLYQREADQCVATTAFNADTPYFMTAACEIPVNALPENQRDFCDTVLDPEKLGNAAVNTTTQDIWSLSPGSRYNIGTLPLDNKAQPYTQRTRYKTVSTPAGECALEMRVYSPHPNATNLTPLIAFHGGSWQYRSTGFLGIEFTATHFVDEGFAVFAPFYRLIGDKDGNEACQNASLEEIVVDAADALTWVEENAARFGATGKPVVFGQSAGGHLAAYLATHEAARVDRAIVYYAPVDFRRFAEDIQSGEYTYEPGIDILEALTGQTKDTVALNSSLIMNNTFTALIEDQVAASPASVTPFFLLYGLSDELLPASQAQRLCNALGGNTETGAGDIGTGTALRYTAVCDNRGSELHFITEGQHALDLCVAPELCLAGGTASAALTEDSLRTVMAWSQKTLRTTNESNSELTQDDLTQEETLSTSSSGSMDPLILLLLTLCTGIVFLRSYPHFFDLATRRHSHGH